MGTGRRGGGGGGVGWVGGVHAARFMRPLLGSPPGGAGGLIFARSGE
eukprot:COSAG06_NODE_1489_length_9283_cov_4.259037_7_plen_46_part_01